MKKSIYRSSDKKGAKGYTPISNKIIQGEGFSLEEMGLLVFLLSLPVDFTIVQKNVQKVLKGRISAGGLRTAWKSLVEKGHIVETKYYSNNLKRIGWVVYETPEIRESDNRESQNRDSREPLPLQSTQLQTTHLQTTELESTLLESNSSIYTGAKILGQKKTEVINKKKDDGKIYFKEALREAKEFLVGATELGEEILKYADPKLHLKLQELVVIESIKLMESLDSITRNLDKYHWAAVELKNIETLNQSDVP